MIVGWHFKPKLLLLTIEASVELPGPAIDGPRLSWSFAGRRVTEALYEAFCISSDFIGMHWWFSVGRRPRCRNVASILVALIRN